MNTSGHTCCCRKSLSHESLLIEVDNLSVMKMLVFLVCFNIVDCMIQILLQCHYMFIVYSGSTSVAVIPSFSVLAVGFCIVLC